MKPSHTALDVWPQIHPLARNVIEEKFSQGKVVCVACSGGADSVFVLRILVELYPNAKDCLCVLHFNHRTRGADSEGDAEFVRGLAEELGVRCVVGQRDRIGTAGEQELREARLAFLHSAMETLDADVLVTGHHAMDVAETMLMRIGRGSGLEGLCAPRPVQVYGRYFHVRPLIDVQKSVLVEALLERGFMWREDASNAESVYLRNWIRNEILPKLESVSERSFVQGASRCRRLLEECDEALAFMVKAVAGDVSDLDTLEIDFFAGQPKAIVRRIVSDWLSGRGLRTLVEAGVMEVCLERLLQGEPFTQTLSSTDRLVFDGRMLSVGSGNSDTKLNYTFEEQAWQAMPLGEDIAVYLPNGYCIKAEVCELSSALVNAIFSGEVNERNEVYLRLGASDRVFVREWCAGDRYRPLGAPGSKKVQDIFTDRKIPVSQRHQLPVVVDVENNILWIPGLPPCENFKLKGEIKVALRLTYEKSC